MPAHKRIGYGLGVAFIALAGCSGPVDLDFRNLGNGFDTSDAVAANVAARPRPDDRGVISYPDYQVVIARQGDTVSDVAGRVGLPAADLARFNGVPDGLVLRDGELLVLPRRVAEPSPATGAVGTGPILPPGSVDVATIAGSAIDRAGGGTGTAAAPASDAPTGIQPIRHRVARGETAFSIARLYGIPVRTLAEWNSLGTDLEVREGQYLLIPVAEAPVEAEPEPAPSPAVAAPGTGSTTPVPPSASQPLPDPEPPKAAPAPTPPPQQEIVAEQTNASDTARLRMPVQGSIIRTYAKGSNEGIGIAAAAGTAVLAADGGTVAAITRDTDQVPILVLRHEGNLLTVYANVDALTVEKGDTVSRGQKIAEVREGAPSFLHFEVREGFESVDPTDYLN